MNDWDDQVICKVNRPENAHLAGRTIGEIARERGQAPIDTALDLVLEDGQFWIAPTIKDQGHLDRLIAQPAVRARSATGSRNHPEKHRAYGLMPKSFGTFPLRARVLRPRPRRPDARGGHPQDHRRTGAPARSRPIAGRCAPGLAADLVVFDPATIGNRATEADPSARPAGIDRVMVNGKWAVIDGRSTGARSGHSL